MPSKLRWTRSKSRDPRTSELGGGKTPLMIWGSRGGNDYAGVEGSKKPEGIPAWLRMAPFDPTTGMVDETSMTQKPFKNLGDTPAWRALSSLDIVGDQMYFTAAYDGEEDGKAVSTEDVLRTGANKEAFRSLVGRLALPDGEPAIVGRYDGLKIEGVMSLGNNQLLLGSDDEALGCGARDGDVDALSASVDDDTVALKPEASVKRWRYDESGGAQSEHTHSLQSHP